MLLSEDCHLSCHSGCRLGCHFYTIAVPGAQELAVLEGANMQTIEDVDDALRRDVDVGEWIVRIQAHPWVQVVEDSDSDVIAVVIEPHTAAKLKEMGSLDRCNNVKGRGEFEDISCAVVARNVFLANIEMGVPREGVNPLTEALVLYDTGLMKRLFNLF